MDSTGLAPALPAMGACPRCGAVQEPRAFCIGCGGRFGVIEPEPARPAAAAGRVSAFVGAARADDFLEDEDTVTHAEGSPGTSRASASSGVQARAPRPARAALTPAPLSIVDRLSSPAIEPSVAKRGDRGRTSKSRRRAQPSATGLAQAALGASLVDDEHAVRAATWSRAVGILVANPMTGTGKTVTSVVLGGVMAVLRGGSVSVLEVTDYAGALSSRSEGSPTRGVGELAEDISSITSAGDLAEYASLQSSLASVVGSVRRRPVLTGADVLSARWVIDQVSWIRVMDSGNNSASSAFLSALSVADILVVPILNTGEAALEAISWLERMRSMGEHAASLARDAVVVRLSNGRAEMPWIGQAVDRLLEDAGIASRTYAVPYDAHLAERGPISVSKLAPDTYRAFTAAAAAVARSLQSTVQ